MKSFFINFIFPLFFLIFFINEEASGQMKQEWLARFNGPGNQSDAGNAMVLDDSGNVYVTGYSTIVLSDFATVKYNSAGILQWAKFYNGPANFYDQASSIALDNSGNVYVTGYSWGGDAAGYDIVTIKYDPSGVQQWLQRYNDTLGIDDFANSMTVDDSGNVFVAGGSVLSYTTIKYNTDGVRQWIAQYSDGGSYNEAYSVVLDKSGNVYVTGKSRSPVSNKFDYATVKYDPAGQEIWAARYNGPDNNNDEAFNVAVDVNGNVYVNGTSYDGTGINGDYATIKYNSFGDSVWVARYNGPGNSGDYTISMALDSSGNIYVTGGSIVDSADSYDYATMKYNNSGERQWISYYNGIGKFVDIAYSITVDGSGNAYVTGGSRDTNEIPDIATVKYNSDGVEQWVERYNGPGNGNDAGHSIAVDGFGSVFITGFSPTNTSSDDIITIKYSPLTNINPVSEVFPEKYSLSQNYPNPFNPSTNLEYRISSAAGGFVSLKVFDMAGKKVKTLVNETKNSGSYSVRFDGRDLSSGIYYYSLYVNGNLIDTKRMVLLK